MGKIVARSLVGLLLFNMAVSGSATDIDQPSHPLSTFQLLTRQALADPGIHWLRTSEDPADTHATLHTEAKMAKIDQRPGRRTFLMAISSVIGLGALPMMAQVAGPTPEQVRQDILTLFRERQNFRVEIDRMFDDNLVAADSGLTRAGLHQAMENFVEFIRGAAIVRSEGNISMGTDFFANKFLYDPARWEAIKEFGIGDLFHEAVHVSETQKIYLRQMDVANNALMDLDYLTPRPSDKARIQREPETRRMIWSGVAYKWKAETQAHYAAIAFLRSEAFGKGQSMREYFLEKAAPRARLAGMDPQNYVNLLLRRNNAKYADSLIAANWRFGTYYNSGSLNLPFKNFVFQVTMMRNGGRPGLGSLYAWLLADNQRIANLIITESLARPVSDADQLLVANWLNDTFWISNGPPAIAVLSRPASRPAAIAYSLHAAWNALMPRPHWLSGTAALRSA